MLIFSLIYIPAILGLLLFFTKGEYLAKVLSLLGSFVVLGLTLYALFLPANSSLLHYHQTWLGSINSNLSLQFDGLAKITVLLTAVGFPLILLGTWGNSYKDIQQYLGLMLLAQAGMMGVFLSADALLFYFFWELALIPTYFLCSKWGGEKRIPVSFKFFIYTFTGSVLMLIGIIYLYYKTPDASFAWSSYKQVILTGTEQMWFFWFFFIAFAIKMPVFPFHTWQPDTYEQAPTSTTMVLSGIMVKMGLYGVARWLVPVFPEASAAMAPVVLVLAVVGMIYASLIAIKQDDIKRLVAYSSIAHIGLMCAAFFVNNSLAYEGAILQLFNHGINIIGLWIVVDIIERQTGVRKMSELGGLAQKAPWMAVLLVVVALANIALPLTNAFVGEFLMFSGLFQYNVWYAVVAGISIILAAVYTLNMVQKVFYGSKVSFPDIKDITSVQAVALALIVGMIIWIGVAPGAMMQLGKMATNAATAVTLP